MSVSKANNTNNTESLSAASTKDTVLLENKDTGKKRRTATSEEKEKFTRAILGKKREESTLPTMDNRFEENPETAKTPLHENRMGGRRSRQDSQTLQNEIIPSPFTHAPENVRKKIPFSDKSEVLNAITQHLKNISPILAKAFENLGAKPTVMQPQHPESSSARTHEVFHKEEKKQPENAVPNIGGIQHSVSFSNTLAATGTPLQETPKETLREDSAAVKQAEFSKLSQTVLRAQETGDPKQKSDPVRMTLPDELLPQTELRLSVGTDGTPVLQFLTDNAESAKFLALHQDALAQAASEATGSPVHIELSERDARRQHSSSAQEIIENENEDE